jgi:putative addiction module killer protein
MVYIRCAMIYSQPMFDLIQSEVFSTWLTKLADSRARARIQARLLRLAQGNPGDVKPIGQGLSELRIDYGPGYRVYFMRRGPVVIVLLCAGDKRTQTADIKRAQLIAREWQE